MFYNQARTEVLSTYALCGFANLGSIGSVIASLGAMAPSRKSEAAMLGMRAMICGTVASYMNTCVAGKDGCNTDKIIVNLILDE